MNRGQKSKLLQALIGQVRKREYPYEPKEKERIDWGAYDRAQVREMNDMLLLIRDSVEEASHRLEDALKKRKGPGRPPTPPTDLAKALLVQQYFGVANRKAEGLLLLFKEKLGLSRKFSYKTIERAYENPDVRNLLDTLFSLTQDAVRDVEKELAVDGTGLPRSMKSNYESDKKGGKRTRGYEKVVTAIGRKYKLFSSFRVMENPHGNESPMLPALMEDSKGYTSLEVVSGDAGFLSRENCTAIETLGAVPRLFPKRGTTFRRKGSDAWVHMLHSFIQDTQGWLREYHSRSIAEGGYSTFKRAFPLPLRRRLRWRRNTEAFTRACCHNLKRLCYLRYLFGIEPTFSFQLGR
ncbi:MAG: transposase [Thermoplasmata archaeon]|nr:transposase [Thermoplasmata archaeon]